MERLTHSDYQGWYVKDPCGRRLRGPHIDRLAEYEDISSPPTELYPTIADIEFCKALITSLKTELRDERDRFDRLSDFEVAEAKQLGDVKAYLDYWQAQAFKTLEMVKLLSDKVIELQAKSLGK